MKVCIITAEELARTHGVGSQLIKLYANNAQFSHLYWHSFHGTESETNRSFKLAEWPIKIRGLGRPARVALKLMRIAWWRGLEVNSSRFLKLTQRIGPIDVAHVVVGDEDSATRARSLVANLGCPYILQLYDIFNPNGISSSIAPNFVELIRDAVSVLTLTPPIQRQCEKIRADVGSIGIGIEPFPLKAQISDSTCRIVLTGRPYKGGCELLARALASDNIDNAVEVNYVGPHYQSLPRDLQLKTRNWGFCDTDQEYHDLLSTMTIGFLSGPDADDQFGRYSFPSRASDLMMAGLPVVGCVRQDSATASVFATAASQVFWRVETVEDVHRAIRKICADWKANSQIARQYAESHFSIDLVRKQLETALRAAATGPFVARSGRGA